MRISFTVVLVGMVAVVMIAAAVALLITDNMRKAKQDRISKMLRPYAPMAKTLDHQDIRAVQEVRAISSADAVNKTLELFGVRAEHMDLYPAPWWALLLGLAALATAVAGLIAATFGPIAWVSQPVLLVFAGRFFFGSLAAKRARILYTQMPDALAMIVRSVRTGLPVSEALRIVGKEAQKPTNAEFERMYNQIVIGTPLTDALIEMAKRTAVPEYRFFAVALSLQGQTGGSLTDTLENLADVIRKRTAMRARAYALSSEARTTMMVLASLPFVAFGALLVLTPSYAALLFETPRGRQILAAAICSLMMGLGLMQFMIKKALS